MYQDIAVEQLKFNMDGMIVLLVWALGNIVFGLILATRYNHSQAKRSFYLMNAAWNFVNLIIAVGGMMMLSRIVPANLQLKQLIYTFFNVEKLILFSIGLDIAFVAIGSFLMERGRHMKKVTFEGYGKALWLQGAFLFLLDMALFLLNTSFNQKYSMFILF